MSKPTFYMTTPIYYPSNNLHIGNAYCSVAADTMCRYKKLRGYDVYFLTGTDEHGQKIERKAAQKGQTPKEFVDEIVAGIQSLWSLMDIQYDQFIRTTDPKHEKIVQKLFKQLYDQGDIYKGEYEGLYCTPCESYWTQLQLKDGCCPDCGRPVETVREEAYFFRLSNYQNWLIDYIETHPDFIQPASRANEMLKNFLRPGLEDLCVSRTSFTWGIPVDFDPSHVVYVWLDALSNYITALGYGTENDALYKKYWPADIHLVGKEIVRFHTIIWPIMLKALGLPLPKQIFGHGWLIFDGKKMSKSMGNVVDPVVLCKRYSADAIRYFLMREIPFGADGEFSNEALLMRINSDLANDLGNLVSRTTAMIEKYFDGNLPEAGEQTQLETALAQEAMQTVETFGDCMDRMHFANALTAVSKLIGESNRYIDQTMPWALARDPELKARLGTVLYTLAENVRIAAVLLGPVMPGVPERIYAQLGLSDEALKTWDSVQSFGRLPSGLHITKGDALFPRLDIAKELQELGVGLVTPETVPAEAPQTPAKVTEAPKEEKEAEALIEIDDFARVKLVVAQVTACEPVPKSDKLLKLTLDTGEGTRTVVSGIAKHYSPDQMVGKKVVLLANLKPAKLRGVVSEGMILAASDESGALNLLTVDGEIGHGAHIS